MFELYGHRLRAFEFKTEVNLFFNELQVSNVNDLVSRYLSLTIYFLIFLIVIWLCLKLIQSRKIEQKKSIVYHKWTSIILLIGIITSLVLNNINKTDWLTKLYLKADRRLVPLVINNPYLLISSFRLENIETADGWNIGNYNSMKEYNSLGLKSYGNIKLIIIEKKELSESKAEDNFIPLSSLNCPTASIFQLLDEVLLSFPGIYDNGFYQSVYSLNKYESLADNLQEIGYSTKLTMIGYDEKIEKLVKNFYGFSINREGVVDIKKNFELVLINAKDNESNMLLANTNMFEANSLIIRMELAATGENKSKPVKSISFTTSDNLPFYKSAATIITQPLDIKPSIIHLTGYNKPFTAFGSSLFSGDEKVIFCSSSDSSQSIIMDSLLLKYSNNETIELRKFEENGFSEFDFKDSLAVERIILENKLQAILRNYKLKLKNNAL